MQLRDFVHLPLLILLGVFCTSELYSQQITPQKITAETEAPAVETPLEAVTREQVEALRARIESSLELTPEEKKTAQDSLSNALNSLAATVDFIAREKLAQENLDKVDERKTALQAKLESLQAPSGVRQQQAILKAELQGYIDNLSDQKISRDINVEKFLKYEQELAQTKNRQIQSKTELDATETRINSRTERLRIRNERLKAIPAEKEKIEAQISQLAALKEGDLREAMKFALLAEKQRLEVEPTTIQAEIALSNAEEIATLSELERQIKNLEQEELKQEVQLYTDTLNRAREIDASNRRTEAEHLLKAASDSTAPWEKLLTPVLQENLAIIDQELEIQPKLKAIQIKVDGVEKERLTLTDEFDQVKTRSGRTGTSRSFGTRLRQQRNVLPDPNVRRHLAYQEMSEYEDAQLKYFDLREQRKRLDDIEDEVKDLLKVVIQNPDNQDESGVELSVEATNVRNQRYQEIENHFRKAYDDQRAYLSFVITAYDKYLQELENYETEQLQLAELSEQIADYIDARVLWIRSHPPITFQNTFSDATSISTLVDGKKWDVVLRCLALDFWSNLFTYSLILVIWIFLLATQSQQTDRIKQTSKKAASRLNVSLKPTIQSLLMTLSKSSILPLPILFLSWRLLQGPTNSTQDISTSKGLLELAMNLQRVGLGLFSLEFIRNVYRPAGLGQSHFNWPELTCKIVYRQIHTLILLLCPLVLLITILDAWKTDEDSEILIRLFTIGAFLCLTSSLQRLTNNSNGAISPWVLQHKNSWIDRFASLLHFFAIVTPISIAVLAGVGFFYTAKELTTKMVLTFLLLFSWHFVRAFLYRWLSIRHRRITLEQARKTRAALAGEEQRPEAVSRSSGTETQEQKIELAELSAQTRRLLNTTIAVLVLLGVWLIWTDVLPALHYFDNVTLPGTSIRFPSLFAAILIAIVTSTAARNIPGLLQITLLEWLPLEKSSRYAIAAVTQYIIAILGLLAISGELEISWDQVQWLVTALTFGLGFGLQEIFANFVSGLIILFEQPVRVGDVVTIDGVSGIVSRIRIRSTTITDWDRKEYIVPNREFITGKLLNWTLTDTTNRFSLSVGVAYGTDPKRVYDILLKVIQSHPVILRDPAPIITLDEFGDSSLNFKIRAFLPGLELRLQTIHDVNVAINSAFAEAGVEIPFPQRDLHIRSAINIPVITPPVADVKTNLEPETPDQKTSPS